MTRVLVIDDDELVGKMVTRYLENFDCQVECVTPPFCVLGTVREFRPDVILLDINMPGLGGGSLAGLLRENRANMNDFKVVLFSSEDEDTQREIVSQSLADGYFLKSGSVKGLEEVITRYAGSPEAPPA